MHVLTLHMNPPTQPMTIISIFKVREVQHKKDLSNLCQATQLGSGRASIQTQAVWL